MEIKNYVTSCQISEIDTFQEAEEIIYSTTYQTAEKSIIKITKASKHLNETEEFGCQIDFNDCIGLINFFKENRICPEHCINIASDLGYKIFPITNQ